MALSCDCGWGDYEWYYVVEDEERIAMTDFRCYGCCTQHPSGSRIRRLKEIEQEYDEADWDEDPVEVIKGYKRLCETCCDLYDSLTELGFCLTADWGFVKEAHKEYLQDYVKR